MDTSSILCRPFYTNLSEMVTDESLDGTIPTPWCSFYSTLDFYGRSRSMPSHQQRNSKSQALEEEEELSIRGLQVSWSLLDDIAQQQLRILSRFHKNTSGGVIEEYAYNEYSTDVLTKSLMKKLQNHFPICKKGESFWLQYSMARDGASLDILLDRVEDTEHSVLAIETTNGEVFGCFVTKPWKQSHDYYGGGQSFLWRNVGPRRVRQRSDMGPWLEDPIEETLEVFRFTFENYNVQLCRPDGLIVGGASTAEKQLMGQKNDWGYALWLEPDLLSGSSEPCSTFRSPPLSTLHSDGSRFEIRNIECWALTPCLSLEAAENTRSQRRLRSGMIKREGLSFELRRQDSESSDL